MIQCLQLLDHALADPAFTLTDFHVLHHCGEFIWRLRETGLTAETAPG